MIVWDRMVLNDGIRHPNLFSLQLDNFIDQCFHNTNPQIVILCFTVVIYDRQVLMDSDEELLHIQLFDELIHYLAQLQETFDDQAGQLGQRWVILVFLQQTEQCAEDVGVLTILEHSQHRRVEVLQYQLTFLVLADLVKVLNEQPCKKLFHQLMHPGLGDFPHDLFGSTCLIDNGYEVLGKSQRYVIDGVPKDVLHYKCKSVHELVAAVYQGFLLVFGFFTVLLCFFILALATGSADDVI